VAKQASWRRRRNLWCHHGVAAYRARNQQKRRGINVSSENQAVSGGVASSVAHRLSMKNKENIMAYAGARKIKRHGRRDKPRMVEASTAYGINKTRNSAKARKASRHAVYIHLCVVAIS